MRAPSAVRPRARPSTAAGRPRFPRAKSGVAKGSPFVRSPPQWRATARLGSALQRPSLPPAHRLAVASVPNPSLKPSPNGKSPGPRYSAVLHFLQRGPGALPSVPA